MVHFHAGYLLGQVWSRIQSDSLCSIIAQTIWAWDTGPLTHLSSPVTIHAHTVPNVCHRRLGLFVGYPIPIRFELLLELLPV